MRYIIALLALVAVAMPAFAAEQATIVKGTKSYQTRYVTSQDGGVKVDQIEPAAGAETVAVEGNQTPVAEVAEEPKAAKKMVLHGKR